MNWLVFFIGAWVATGLELGLRDGLSLGPTGAAPSFVLIYLTAIALATPRATAVWAGFILGLLLDLTRAMPAADGMSVVWTVGPMTLGGAMAAYTATLLRGSLYQRNPLAGPVVVAVAVFLANIIALAPLAARDWYDPMIDLAASHELARAGLIAVYSAGAALVLALLLRPVAPLGASLFMFHPTPSTWRWGTSRRSSGHR